MKENLWTKTLLCGYKYLEKIADVIDRLVKSNALSLKGTLETYNKISNLIERKIELINLKVLIDEVIGELDEEDLRILVAKFIDNHSSMELVSLFKTSERTIARKIENACTAFSKKLLLKGYSNEYLEKMLKEQKWLLSIYDEFSKRKKQSNYILNFSKIITGASLDLSGYSKYSYFS